MKFLTEIRQAAAFTKSHQNDPRDTTLAGKNVDLLPLWQILPSGAAASGVRVGKLIQKPFRDS
jgi:hypothetical protein